MKQIFRIKFLALICVFSFSKAYAVEGMWIPMLLKSLNENEMKDMGMRLSAEDIYSVNTSSLKDAVFLFGRGCTAELISNKGLLLTNHHCGFGNIQSHTTLENDYLKYGFWANNTKEELPNKGLTATRIVRMENVTDLVISPPVTGLSMNPNERTPVITDQATIDANIKKICAQAVAGTHYEAVVRPFYYGNEYYLFVIEVFKDVRLVGAPPSSVGVFGGDTDNWMWPRHNADFSVFRIYTDKNNKPAEFSENNVPYTPVKHLSISLKGVKENDFTMVYGFPGRTQEYLPSDAVELIINDLNPMRIKMRTASLNILRTAIANNDTLRIKYSAKAAGIANAWKKWQGELKGLKRLDAVNIKKAFEKVFVKNTRTDKPYHDVLSELQALYTTYKPASLALEYYSELFTNGAEVIRLANNMSGAYDKSKLLVTKDKHLKDSLGIEINKALDKFSASLDGFFSDYDARIDQQLMKVILPIFLDGVGDANITATLKKECAEAKSDMNVLVNGLFASTVFSDPVKLKNWIAATKKDIPKGMKMLEKDKIFLISYELYKKYNEELLPAFIKVNTGVQEKMKTYMKGIMTYPGKKKLYPDANSTLRVSYGKVEGFSPYDGATYTYYSTIDGVIEKYKPGDAEFDLLPRFLELYNNKDYGQYGQDGELRVTFLASNHTTGGNSGSPVLNADGQLVGINFDRAWESTMSDIMYDPEKCRNIVVDIRYVLWVIDKYAGATHLVNEMTIIK